MQQTETAIVGEHHVNLRSILDYIKEHRPYGFRIPVKFLAIPAAIIFLLVLGSSFIRAPENLTPASGSVISRTPTFSFSLVKNMFYQGYEVELRSAGSRGEVQTYVYENAGVVTVTTPSTLPRQSRMELLVKMNKGLGPLTVWSKTYTYTYRTTPN